MRKALLSAVLILLVCHAGFLRVANSFCNPVSERVLGRFMSEVKALRFIFSSSVTFFNGGNFTWVLSDGDRAFGLFMNNSWQTVSLINCSHPLEVLTDRDGNLMAVLGSERAVEPGESASYFVSYNVLLRSRSVSELMESESGLVSDIPYYLREIFCAPSPPFLVWDEEVRRVALSLAGSESNVLRIVKRFVGWIWGNIRYPSVAHEIPYYPNETLKGGEGDCDDQAILFATFCRVLGIPAYVQIGYVYLSDFEYNGTGWDGHVRSELVNVCGHGWAIVYIPPWGWLPVDLTFVLGSPTDPVNAIRFSAVVAYPGVVQYANISEGDYVAGTRAYRDFLLQNDFYILSRDQMSKAFLGDLNCDGFVNMIDLNFAARVFGLTVESRKWNGLADVAEPFGVINIADLTEIAREFGMPYS